MQSTLLQCLLCMQVRSAKLADLPMTSLALLPQSGSEGLHPIVLAACYDNKVRFNDSYTCLSIKRQACWYFY